MWSRWGSEGRSPVIRDLRILQKSTGMFWTPSGCIAEAVICIRMITNCLEDCSPEHSTSAEALSISILYLICSQSHENSVLRSIYEKIASLTPSPCLVPLASPLAPASKALEAEVNVCVTFVDYSQCGRYLVAGAYKKGVIVLGAETREVIKRLKFPKYPANAVKPPRQLTDQSIFGTGTFVFWTSIMSRKLVALTANKVVTCAVTWRSVPTDI